ncbi:MAG: phage portal protein [Planctomycetaceae bacterium]|jgi:lambda family phage portal protein|nr:phage portal protein [Planctomycetaceae bacterium]
MSITSFFGKVKSAAKTIYLSASPHKLTYKEERAYWSEANSLSADGFITPEMRRTWRNRARLEANCNSYARGLILTLADMCIGTGARLQLLTENEEYNSQVEQEFTAWAEAINLGEKLKTLRKAKCVDGEAFAVIAKNPKVKHPVKIDLKIIESDRVTTPFAKMFQKVDGIHFDDFGNPVSYDVLKEHPGDLTFHLFAKTESVPAEYMLHWYRQDRPEQSRGITELLPSLPLFAQLRRYTLAVIEAAETAASIAGVVYTKNQDITTANINTEQKKTIDIERNMFNVLPEGWEMNQLKAEQPTTTYSMFKREILSEIGRCLQMPVNIILGDSSNFNYASGRLDHQTFNKNIRNEQTQCERVVLFPLLEMWHSEATRIELVEEYKRPQISSQFARFYWDGLEHVDPFKEANAMATRVKSRFTNYLIECARLGYDWEDVFKQAAREQELLKKLGLQVQSDNNNKKDNEEGEEE